MSINSPNVSALQCEAPIVEVLTAGFLRPLAPKLLSRRATDQSLFN